MPAQVPCSLTVLLARLGSHARLFSLGGLSLLLMMTLPGCGRNEFQTTPVCGIVFCHGEVVREGTISFTPIPQPGQSISGKTAMAMIKEDGTFELATYAPGDGAILGRHRVMYSLPGGPAGKTPCGTMVVQEVEITKETHEISIELSRK